MRAFFLNLILISSLLFPRLGMVTEDISFLNTPHIRTLAGSCAACHGTNGNAVGNNAEDETKTLAGLDQAYIRQRLTDFRSGARPSTVMHRHTRGLTDKEINQLADYFSRQKVVKNTPPASQIFEVTNHE